jgi:N-acyl-D-aspartate/D-glutamate deacylase
MKQLLRDGLRAGGFGFSSTWARSHNDHLGQPVPSRHANTDELLAFCSVVGEFPGTTLEFIPGVPPFNDELCELLAAMSRAANRPINWNVLPVYADNQDLVARALAGNHYAAELGGRVIGLTMPDSVRNRLNFRSGFILDVLPGWERVMALPEEQKLATLADPAGRAEMARDAASAQGLVKMIADWDQYTILETFSEETKPFEGMALRDIAKRTNQSSFDALADIVVKDRLRTIILNQDHGQDVESWRKRVNVWRDPTMVVGASDAGAHLDMIDTFSYPTTLLAMAVRRYGLLPIEEAVRYLTETPATLYGFRDRGCLRPGAWADIAVFDPDAVGPGPVSTRSDLPGGAPRVYGAAVGMEHVLVAGTEIVTDGQITSERPGRVLRSGRDTTTVTAASPGLQ